MFNISGRRLRSSPLTWIAFAVICFVLYQGWSRTTGSPTIHRHGPNGEDYAPLYVNKLPSSSYQTLPRLQADFPTESEADRTERENRQAAVRDRFVQTWASYKEKAYGADELKPISGQSLTTFGGWGASLVDSLDSLWILGLKKEFEEAVAKTSLINFGQTQVQEINVFETTIRYLGGLLGAYDISGGQYPILLEKAVEVGELVYGAFDTPNRMPITRYKIHDQTNKKASNWALIAEIGSLNLELTRLSQLTGNGKYYDAAYRVARAMDEAQQGTMIPGLWPIIADAEKIKFDRNMFGLGGMADSAYEYLPKMHALVGGGDDMYKRDYERAIKASRQHLFYRPMLPDNADILVSGSVSIQDNVPFLEPQGQHLTCFAGGMVLMGSKLFGRTEEFEIGRKLTEGCIWAYKSMPSGIMPEVFHMVPCSRLEPCEWSEERWIDGILNRQSENEELVGLDDSQKIQWVLAEQKLKPGYTQYDNAMYILRPEAIESVFYLYRMTGDKKYADIAWEMWLAIDRNTRTDIAHAGIFNVASDHPEKMDKMESFWLAETLKYFYLIFSHPELMSLDRYVLNTEAHPFLRPNAEWRENILQ